MPSRFKFYLSMAIPFVLLLLLSVSGDGDHDYTQEPALDSGEQEAVYKVLEAINSDIDWRGLFPDNLCTGGPHGVVCDFDAEDSKWHIVELNLGWVFDSGNNPPCGRNASFSPYIVSIPRLRKLFFYRCFMHMTLTIPAYIWPALGEGGVEELIFQDNPALQGFLPPELGTLTGLRRFILSGTSMGGTVPTEIGKLKNLRQLDLSANSFSGRIPESLGGLKELVILDLNHNEFEGCVSPKFGELVKIAKIDVSYNHLNGALPASLVHLQAMELMDMSFNNLSGGVPLFLAELSKLRYLYLSGNPALGGFIPDTWGRVANLRSLGLSSAGLVGRIPCSIGSLKDLNYLALDNNKLVGIIPTEFGSMPQIYEMNLSANELTGLVPFSASFVTKMGRKLGLEGNSGLCYDQKATIGRATGAMHLKSCVDLSLPESVVQDRKIGLPVSRSTRNLQMDRMKFKLFVGVFPAALIFATFL